MRKILSCLIFLGAFVGAQADMGEIFNCKNSGECSVRINCPRCARVWSVILVDKNGQEHPVDDFRINYDNNEIHIEEGVDLSHYNYALCIFLNENGKETRQRISLQNGCAEQTTNSKVSCAR